MPYTITINNITGATDFDIYLCDTGFTSCIYIDTINTTPYTFDVPFVLESQTEFGLKVVDDNDCIITQILT